MNLLDKLSNEDKTTIDNYIKAYGIKSRFIGVDSWLEHWSKNKTKLYKLLGNNLIVKIPFSSEEFYKEELEKRISKLLTNKEHDFASKMRTAIFHKINDACVHNCFNSNYSDLENCLLYLYQLLQDTDTFISNKIEYGKLTYLSNKAGAKELRISSGIRPIKAIHKILTYLSNNGDYIPYEGWEKDYEDFRIQLSLATNDKCNDAKLVLSIHPLDFMTMSDNASKWQSCMSWKNWGCYRVGTVEMMNSNNTICCYIESKDPFEFEGGKWNNKRWRQLFIVNKDIIVSGKAYPYYMKEATTTLLNALRGLAKENLKWNYTFGPELYRDMIHINTDYGLDKMHDYLVDRNMTKHNIIFTTKGMYNDYLNDSGTKYWCVRNKVKHNKYYSYSGKTKCLCCGQPSIEYNYNYENDYDEDQYTNLDRFVCEECQENYFACAQCDNNDGEETTGIMVPSNYGWEEGKFNEVRLCGKCWDKYVRRCPDCGEPIYVASWYGSESTFTSTVPKAFINKEDFRNVNIEDDEINVDGFQRTLRPVFLCEECAEKRGRESVSIDFSTAYYRHTDHYALIDFPEEEKEKFYYENLEKVPKQEGLKVKKL